MADSIESFSPQDLSAMEERARSGLLYSCKDVLVLIARVRALVDRARDLEKALRETEDARDSALRGYAELKRRAGRNL